MTCIWRFSDPQDARFARASRRGTWSQEGVTCRDCGSSNQQRISPLVIEWEPDSDHIGDFVWSGFGADIAVTERVGSALQERFSGIELGPVDMIQDSQLTPSKRAKLRVWLPYQGPPLVDVCVTVWVHLNLHRSTAQLLSRCSTCPAQRYAFGGLEKYVTHWDKERMESVITHVPRSPKEGLFVDKRQLNGVGVFRIHEYPKAIFCTDLVKSFVEQAPFTNVRFLEVGTLI